MAAWTSVEGLLADGQPIRIYLAEDDSKIWAASVCDVTHPKSKDEFLARLGRMRSWKRDSSSIILSTAVRQIAEYLHGRRRHFDLPFAWRGTAFQIRVWKHVTRIPFGSWQTYREVAGAIDMPETSRSVVAVNRSNPFALLVPSHRVLATGVAKAPASEKARGSVSIRERLLAHECATVNMLSPRSRRDNVVDIAEKRRRIG